MPLLSRLIVAACAVMLFGTGTSGLAATTAVWNGAGVTGGTTATDWSALANYTGATAFSTGQILDFSLLSGTNTLTAAAGTYDAGGLSFGSTSAAGPSTTVKTTLAGNGTAGAVTLNLTGNIVLASPSASVMTLASDLTLNLSNGAHTLGFANNPNVTSTTLPTIPVLVINALVTGGGSAATLAQNFSAYGPSGSQTPAYVLTNNANTFDASFNQVRSALSYTSIANVGQASSLGAATTAANGLIYLSNGAAFSYIGSGNQATDRAIAYSSTMGIYNFATSPSTLTFNGTMTASATAAATIRTAASSGNTIVYNTTISDGGSYATSLTKWSGATYYDATGTAKSGNGNGTVVLKGANTYSGGTQIQAGTLLVANTTGSGTGTGNVTFTANAAAALGGTGTVAPTGANNVTVSSGNFISPGGVDGVAVGTLTFDGGGTTGNVLVMQTGSKLAFDLGPSNASDRIVFLNYAAGDLTLNANTFAFSGAQAGTYVLFQMFADGGTTLAATGLNASSFNLAGSTGLAGFTATLDTTSVTGEVLLTLVAVPEPSEWALLGLGAAAFAVSRRRFVLSRLRA